MKQLSVLMISLLFFSSCSSFIKQDESGMTKGKVIISNLEKLRITEKQKMKKLSLSLDSRTKAELNAAWIENCGFSGEKKKELKAAGVTPLAFLPTLVKFAFDFNMDANIKQAKAVSEGATFTRSAHMRLKGGDIKKMKCLLIVRLSEIKNPNSSDLEESVGLVALLKINNLPKDDKNQGIFTLNPLYIRAINTGALVKKGKPKTINVAFALTMKMITLDQNGLKQLLPFGVSSVAVKKIPFGVDAKAWPIADESNENDISQPSSEMIPLPPEGELISFNLAISEHGNVGFNFDEFKAQQEAIKSAMGPAIQSYISELIKEE